MAGKVTRQGLQAALGMATTMKREALAPPIKAALDKLPAESGPPAFTVDAAALPRYVGTYREAASGLTMTVSQQGEALMAQVQGQPLVRLVPSAADVFRVVEVNATLTFSSRAGPAESVAFVQGPANLTLARVPAEAAAAPPPAPAPAAPPAAASVTRSTGPRNWPSFRGDGGGGNGDGQRAVTEWDVTTGRNIKWKAEIPGVATSSPIVWGNRVFVTTAVSRSGDKTFKTGLYGDVKPVEDLSVHDWKVYSLDKASGKILWERTAFTGAPKTKRHTEEQSGQLHPGDRRPACGRGVRSRGPADGVGLCRQGTVGDRSGGAGQWLVLRPGLPMGTLQLADHPSQRRDPAG